MDTQWKGRALGAILLESAMIKAEDIERALAEQKKTGMRFGEALVELGIVSKEDVNWGLSHQLNMPFVRIRAELVDPEASRLLPEAVARRHRALPYLLIGDELTVVMEDPTNERATAELAAVTGKRIIVGVGMPDQIDEALDHIYGAADAPRLSADVESDLFNPSQIAAMTADATGRHFLELLLASAVAGRADSVHFDPEADGVRVRFRSGEATRSAAYLSRSWMHVVERGLRGMLRETDTRPGLLEGALVFRHAEGETAFLAALAETADGLAVTLTSLAPPPVGETLEQAVGDPATLTALAALLSTSSGLTIVAGPEGAAKRRFVELLLRAHEERFVKRALVGRWPRPVGGGWLRIKPAAETPGAVLAALDAALALGPDALVIDDLSDPAVLNAAVREAAGGRLIVGMAPFTTTAAALEYAAEAAVSRAALCEALRGFVLFDMVRRLSPEHSQPDRRSEQAARALGLPLKKVKAAKLRRPAPGTGYPAPHLRRPLAAVTPVDEALAGLRAGLPAMQVAEALRGTWRKQMTELLAPEVLSGRLALDDYLTIVEGRGHGAA